MSTFPPNIPLSNVVRRTIIGFGDSITNQNFDSGVSTPPSYSGKGDIIWANSILKWPFNIIGNGGVSGDTTTMMLARLQTILNYGASIVRFMGGTNDQTSILSGDINTPGTTIYNIYTICEALRNSGSLVVLCTVIPNSYMVGTGTADTRRIHFSNVNRWIRSYASSTKGIVLCDYARVLSDPITSGPITGTTIDGTHPSSRGASLMGQELANVLTPFISSCDLAANFSNWDYLNYAVNPLASGNNASGTNGWSAVTGITGNGPDGWTSQIRYTATAVSSKVTRSDGRYIDTLAQMVISGGANSFSYGAYRSGSDEILGTGRYDQGWVANTAYTIGARKRPTVANGYIYKVVIAGTTGASQPTWPTTEGQTVVDNTITWMCQRIPQSGDQFYGVAEVTMSNLTSGYWAYPYINLKAVDTLGNSILSVNSLLADLSGSYEGPQYLPNTPMTLVTPIAPIVPVNGNAIRHFVLTVAGVVQANANVTMTVGRVGIYRTN